MIYHTTLFVMGDDGVAKAVDVLNGHTLWHRSVGTLAAASPAVAANQGLVVMPVLSTHGRSPGGGRFVALSMRNGHVVWSKPLPAGSESSPIVHGSTVYFGDQGGTLWALSLRHGHVDWTYHASGAIKGGPALVNGVLYFGDYAGRAYAINASNGHQIWAVGTSGAHFGFGSGNFYATPAVAFGRVYMGNTDGRVYSFGARTGALAWATSTGAYVYASASVADPPGLGPTVYVGSYDGNLYAFNARSGAVRWRHPAGGKISGSSTVIGNVVYYSDLGTKTTTGLDATTGRTVFSFPDGAFTPVIADYHALYLDGYGTIYQLLPGRRPVAHKPPPKPTSSRRADRSARPSASSTGPRESAHDRSTDAPDNPRLRPALLKAAQNRAAHRLSGRPVIIQGLCVVVVEVTVSIRLRRAVGSAQSTQPSSIACARSSRMPPPLASVVAGPSGRPHAVVPAATSHAFRPPRTAMRAPRLDTWKRPPKRGRLAVES